MFYAVLLLEQDKFYWGLQIVILPYDKEACFNSTVPQYVDHIVPVQISLGTPVFFYLGYRILHTKKHQKQAPNELIQVWEAIYLH